MKTMTAVLLSVVIAFSLTACDLEEFAGATKFKEDFAYTYDLDPGGRLSVESFNGSIEITGWDKPSVEITGTRYAATRKLMESLKIDIVESDGAIRVRTVKPSGRWGNMGAAYVIRAPRQVEIERVISSNGSIHVEDITGNAQLKTSNGKVRVAELDGDIEATTSNGSVQLARISGAAVLRTSNGSIKAEAIRGHFEAKTSNGGINLTLDQNPTSDIRASTSNGSITLSAPDSLAARIKANTSNASVSSDFDVALDGGLQKKKNRLQGTIGGGGPLVDLDSSNGSIRLKRLGGD